MTIDEEAQLAGAVLALIGRIVDAFGAAKLGQIAPADVLAQITALHMALAQNDAAAAAALAAKFPPKEGP